MQAATAPAIDASAVLDSVRSRLDRGPADARILDAYLAKLAPGRWTIEWELPRWLAKRLGLDAELASSLVESNVLGLLSVRLTDDIVDGDIETADADAARALAAVAFDAALVPYRELFPPGSSFWVFVDRCMADWRAASRGADLAARAAPVKVVAFACCLLAGRNDLWPALERCLDEAMRALVLSDDFSDWEADVEAGRWNTFVAATVGERSGDARPERVRAAVMTAMLTRNVVQAHVERIGSAASLAAELADDLGLDELGPWLRAWAIGEVERGDTVAQHYRGVADRATRLLFADAVGMKV